MSEVSTSANRIQAESIQYQAPVSESALTSMGAAINYCLKKLVPVGTVLPSMLNQSQFNAEVGAGYWVLCNGGSCTGSNYASLTGASVVPDMRGVFVRGKNNGRSDGAQNPDGELNLGQYQSDQFGSHTHTTTYFREDPPYASTHHRYQKGDGEATLTLTTSAAGGNETRAKNVTVNYFIRIN